MDVNTYIRNIRPRQQQWRCTTCGIHRHGSWWASRTVVGTVTHTMAGPTCPRQSERQDARPPTFDSLDRELAAASSAQMGTLIDRVGSRYYLSNTSAVWETREVLRVRADHSLLFAPNWYHRVVPPPSDASHAAVTFRAAYNHDFQNEDSRQLDSSSTGVENSNYHVCHTRWDLILALRHPHLAQAHMRARGLPIPKCSIPSIPLHCLSRETAMGTARCALHHTSNKTLVRHMSQQLRGPPFVRP